MAIKKGKFTDELSPVEKMLSIKQEKAKRVVKKSEAKELKDTRLNVVMTQSLVEDFKLYALSLRRSVNSVFNDVIQEAVDKHRADIENARKFFNKK